MIFCDSWAKFKVSVWALEVCFSGIMKSHSRCWKFILLEVLLAKRTNNKDFIALLYLLTSSFI
jgi:hypothetical protein